MENEYIKPTRKRERKEDIYVNLEYHKLFTHRSFTPG